MRRMAIWLSVLMTIALIVSCGWQRLGLWLEGFCEHDWALAVVARVVTVVLMPLQLAGVQ